MNANRNRLAEEQMEALRQNPYVLSVTQTRISLTKEFKELFHHCVSFHSKCKVWEQRPDTVRQFKEPCQCGVPRIF